MPAPTQLSELCSAADIYRRGPRILAAASFATGLLSLSSMASDRPLFVSCEVVWTLRTIVPHETRMAKRTQTLSEFAEDYLSSALAGEAEFRLEPDVVGLLSRVEARAQVPRDHYAE